MGKTSEFHPVTALIAESDSTTRRAIQIFAETHTEVQLCAVVATGQEMLDSLEQGMRPEVLLAALKNAGAEPEDTPQPTPKYTKTDQFLAGLSGGKESAEHLAHGHGGTVAVELR